MDLLAGQRGANLRRLPLPDVEIQIGVENRIITTYLKVRHYQQQETLRIMVEQRRCQVTVTKSYSPAGERHRNVMYAPFG
jgi:hypothetical protein